MDFPPNSTNEEYAQGMYTITLPWRNSETEFRKLYISVENGMWKYDQGNFFTYVERKHQSN